jgi:hypothetical protein
MKLSVIIGRNGNVLATMRHDGEKSEGSPDISLTAAKGQKVHEIELPSGLEEQVEDELHRTVKRQIKGSGTKTKKKAGKGSRKKR